MNLCAMGGCEYLPSIERVGLKVVLNHLEKHETCEKVIEHLRN